MLVPSSLRQVPYTGTPVSIGWFEVLEVLCMWATQVLLCLPIGWVELLEVLRMLDCTGTCVPIGWDEVFEVLLLDGRVVLHTVCYTLFQTSWPPWYFCACLLVVLKCWKFCGCWMHRYLCAYRLG